MLRCVVSAVLLVALWGSGVFAQIGDLPEKQPHFSRVAVGFSSFVRSDSWIPIRLMVQNPGAATDVEVVVYAADSVGSRMPLLVRAPLHLPADSIRRHTMYVRTGNCEKLLFELYDKNQRLTNRASVAPAHISASEPLILGLSNNGMGFVCTQEPSASERLRFNNALGFSDLPERRQGYEAVDVIILGSLPAEQITVLQQRAIIEWVRAGGLLVFSPGAYTHNYEGTLLEGILPAQILGSRLVEGLPPLEDIYGPIKREKQRLGLTEIVASDGTVNLQMGQFPLVVSRPEGAGRVVFVAFDLSGERMLSWPHLIKFYRDLTDRQGRLPDIRKTRLPAEASAILNEYMGVKVMPRRQVAGFLCVNVILVVIVLVGARKRREYGFLILLFCAPVLALAINAFGRAAANITEPLAAGLHVVRTVSGQSGGAGNGFHAVLSDKEARSDVIFPDTPSLFCQALPVMPEKGKQLTSAEAAQESYEMADEDLKWLRDLRLRPRSVSVLESSYLATMPGAVSAVAVFDGKGISVAVKNESNAPFERGFIAYNRNAAILDDLAPGESATVRLSGATAQGLMAGFSRKPLKDKREAENDRVINSLYAVNVARQIADTGLHVFGWIEREPVTLKLEGLAAAPKSSGRTLWIITPQRRMEGKRFLLPKGSLAMRLSNTKSNIFRWGNWADIYGLGMMTVDFGVPVELRDMKPTRMSLFLRTGQAPALVALEVFDWQAGKYDVLVGEPVDGEPQARPVRADRTTFEVKFPEKYLSPGRGIVRVSLVIKSIHNEIVDSVGNRIPIIEDLDLEIEGIHE